MPRSSHRPRPGFGSGGFGIVEMLIVIAIVGILAALTASRLMAPDARLFSENLQGLLEQARHEAVKRHVPVAVVWTGTDFAVRTQAAGDMSIGTVCTTGTSLHVRGPASFRGITLVNGGLLAGLVWLPSGLVRACDGLDLTTVAAVTVGDGRTTRVVEVWPAGAVTLR